MMFTSLTLVICTGLSRRLSEQQWCLYHWFQYYVADYQEDWASSNDVYIIDFNNMYRTIKTIDRAAMMFTSLILIICTGLSRLFSKQCCLYRTLYWTIMIEQAAMMFTSLILIICTGLSRLFSKQCCLYRTLYWTIMIERAAMMSISIIYYYAMEVDYQNWASSDVYINFAKEYHYILQEGIDTLRRWLLSGTLFWPCYTGVVGRIGCVEKLR